MQAELYDGVMVELRPGIKLVECGVCGWCHPQDFNGDCREDTARFYTPENPDETNFAEWFDEDDDRNPNPFDSTPTPGRYLRRPYT